MSAKTYRLPRPSVLAGMSMILLLAGCHLHVTVVDPHSDSGKSVEENKATQTTPRHPEILQTQAQVPMLRETAPPPALTNPVAAPPPAPIPMPPTAGKVEPPKVESPSIPAPRIAPNVPAPAVNAPETEMAPSPGMVLPESRTLSSPIIPSPGIGLPAGYVQPIPPRGFIPTEKAKTSLPPYVIEPPDILFLDPIKLVPRPPYLVGPLDILLIRVADPLPNQPIEGTYTVTPDGTINLGYNYGQVPVTGLSLDEIEVAIRRRLSRVLTNPQVAVGLAQFRGVQQTRGEHLVRPDGTISLGSYGCVYVAGLTLNQAKVAIERHLGQYLQEPELSVDVFAYNSKVYYVITDGAGFGMQVFRFPVTGNETVLDAISNIQGLPAVASRKKIWVARPGPANHPCSQILPVDWLAIAEGGATTTNYQIFPGDRIYLQSDPLIKMDNMLAKVLAPFERILGFGLLTGFTINSFRGNNNNNNSGVGFIAN
ncbi:MAG: polysaccharide biosynthesis/export family protein [Gemmataceae bacterium]